MDQKRCGRCGETKSLEDFPKRKSSKDGRNSWCRSCYRDWHRGRYISKGTDAPRACETCGVEYTPKQRNGTQRFCSPACKVKARYWRRNPREKRACLVCQADITHMRRDARFCSDVCAAKFNNGKRTPEQRRAYKIRSNYGISVEDYDRMLAEQSGGCAICGGSGATSRGGILHVDHCHNSKRVRGLLCESCNHALGKFKDDPALLRRAATYLERGV